MWPFRKNRQASGLVIDPTYGDPPARAITAALSARDWRTARDILAATTDPDARAFLMEAVGQVDGVQEWIGEWIAAEPESTLPVLVRGCHGIFWAWEARGGKRAQYTAEEQFREFRRRLRIAENALDDVVARDPADVTAWTWLVTSSRGRQVDAGEARSRFDEVVKLHPHHVVAYEQRLQYLCPKWFGDEQQMFAFAREATASAPNGSLVPETLAVAHVEKWLDLPDGADNDYIRSADVVADLHAAADKSIFHPAFRPAFGWVPRASVFALAFELANEFAAAARVFEMLGDQVSEWPWQYCGEPVAVFTRSRNRVHENLA